jgi:hypothetical protein
MAGDATRHIIPTALTAASVALAGSLFAQSDSPSIPERYERALSAATVRQDSLANIAENSLLIGNGDINGLIYAKDGKLQLRITKNDVWDARLDTSRDPALATIDPATHEIVGGGNPDSYMNEVAAELGLFPRVFLQVNVSGEATKGGFEPAALAAELPALLALDHCRIQGLMTIPPAGPDAASARPWFARLRELRDDLERRHGVRLPGLSMGMSGDFEVAIAEGATHVRVGSAIFGDRAYRVDGELG